VTVYFRFHIALRLRTSGAIPHLLPCFDGAHSDSFIYFPLSEANFT